MISTGPYLRRLALPLVGLFAACTSSPTAVDGLLDDLARAEARWLDARPYRYTAVERRVCECTPAMTGPVRLEVSLSVSYGPLPREVIVGATYVDGGEPVDEDHIGLFLPVEGLFALIHQAVAADPDQLDVDFHPVLGYPTRISVDYDRQVADDELEIFLQFTESED